MPLRPVRGRRQPGAAGADAARPRGGRHRRAGRAPRLPTSPSGSASCMTFLPRCGECAACATDGLAPCIARQRRQRGGHPAGRRHAVDRATASRCCITSGSRRSPPTPSSTAARSCPSTPTFRRWWRRCWAVRCSPAAAPSSTPAAAPRADGRRGRHGRRRHGRDADRAGATTTSASSAVDQVRDKLGRARALGAHDACTPEEATDRGLKAEVVIEAVGHPSALETAIGLTAPGGRTITVGLPHPDARISLSPVGFRRGGPVADRQLPGFVGARQRHSALRADVAGRPACGRITGLLDDQAR